MLTPAGWTYDPIEAERIMPTPKLNRGDYVHCEACDVIVPKSKLVEESDFFTTKTETKCPYCGGTKLVPLDEPAA